MCWAVWGGTPHLGTCSNENAFPQSVKPSSVGTQRQTAPAMSPTLAQQKDLPDADVLVHSLPVLTLNKMNLSQPLASCRN